MEDARCDVPEFVVAIGILLMVHFELLQVVGLLAAEVGFLDLEVALCAALLDRAPYAKDHMQH